MNSKNKIKDLLKREMDLGIRAVLKGKAKTFKCWFVTPKMFSDYMRKLKFRVSNLEQNSVDWWIECEKNGIKYTGFCSGYDGKFIFEQNEDTSL